MAMRRRWFQLLAGVKVGTGRDWREEKWDVVTVTAVIKIRLSLGSTSRCVTNVTPGCNTIKENQLLLASMGDYYTCSLLCDKPLVDHVRSPKPLHCPSYQM